jgi:DNA segregation ATPase FtsK/SpoIIIE-like protein
VRFTIIDPVGLGQNFAGFMHLADHDEALVGTRIWTEQDHINQQLANLTEHMETVIQKYLRNEFATIDEYNAQAGELAEPYRYLIIADFPVGFEGDAYRRLNSIATSGARCGVFFIIVRDTRQTPAAGAHLDELEAHSINLVRKDGAFVWKDEIFKQFPLRVDAPPSEQFLTDILEMVGRQAKESKRVEVPFETIAPEGTRIWSGDSKDELQVPIGRLGATRLQLLKLGRGVAQHALIAGKTGSGKSTLLHVLVTNLALWYSPEQVEFYLVDSRRAWSLKPTRRTGFRTRGRSQWNRIANLA